MFQKLNIHAQNETSQHGEDGILQYLISLLGDKCIPSCCEFGAWDGIAMSNTYRLWAKQGWSAILIEGDAKKYPLLLENTRAFPKVRAFRQMLEARGAGCLDTLFAREGLESEIGLLSIDIDSIDYYIFKYLERVHPQIVVVEFNQGIPPHIDYVDPEGQVYLRCSAKALERLGREKGFRLACCTKTNAIFLREDLAAACHIPELPVEYLFDYSELAPAQIRINHANSKYPIWTSRQRGGLKFLNKAYYFLSAKLNRKQSWIKPPAEVREAMRRAGLDF